jgi:hypothetical protein
MLSVMAACSRESYHNFELECIQGIKPLPLSRRPDNRKCSRMRVAGIPYNWTRHSQTGNGCPMNPPVSEMASVLGKNTIDLGSLVPRCSGYKYAIIGSLAEKEHAQLIAYLSTVQPNTSRQNQKCSTK